MDCNSWKACAICGGNGTISDFHEEMNCPNCNGSGCDHYDGEYTENCRGFCPECIKED